AGETRLHREVPVSTFFATDIEHDERGAAPDAQYVGSSQCSGKRLGVRLTQDISASRNEPHDFFAANHRVEVARDGLGFRKLRQPQAPRLSARRLASRQPMSRLNTA